MIIILIMINFYFVIHKTKNCIVGIKNVHPCTSITREHEPIFKI